MDIKPVDIPAFLGLGVLDGEQLYADNVTNRLVHRQVLSRRVEQLKYEDCWHVPLHRCYSHFYARMKFLMHTFYTSAQLLKMRRNFGQPSVVKQYNLLKRAGLKEVEKSTLEDLEKIVANCDQCQRIENASLHFSVSMGHENVRYDARVCLDIMCLDGKPVLHIVDEATQFSSARFLPIISTDAVWDSIVLCCSSVLFHAKFRCTP